MLVFSIMVLALILIAAGLIFTVHFIFFCQKRLQNQTEQLALRAVRIMNEGDRAGQMNNLVADSRQLVFNSRKAYEDASQNYQHLEPLARQLLFEAKDGARLVRYERDRLAQITLADLRRLIKEVGEKEGSSGSITLPWVQTSEGHIATFEIGYIKNVESNVEAPVGNPELLDWDREQGYTDNTSNLYLGNKALVLPAPDTDITFMISSLPAPVKRTVAPARLTSGEVFKCIVPLVKGGSTTNSRTDLLPSAIRLSQTMKVKSFVGKETSDSVSVNSVAAAGGASPPLP